MTSPRDYEPFCRPSLHIIRGQFLNLVRSGVLSPHIPPILPRAALVLPGIHRRGSTCNAQSLGPDEKKQRKESKQFCRGEGESMRR